MEKERNIDRQGGKVIRVQFLGLDCLGLSPRSAAESYQLLNFSVPQFPQLQMRNINSVYLQRLL